MDKKKVLLVGCGGISELWLQAIAAMDDVEVVGLADHARENAEEKAQKHEIPMERVYTDLEKALDETQPEIVFDCTVPEARQAVTGRALERGCHVLCEKPLGDSMEAAQTIVRLSREKGRVCAVMQNRRFDRNIRRLKAFLLSGAIGQVTTVHCDFFIGAHFAGFRVEMPHVLLLDMAVHTFDAARFITGARPLSVFCKEWNPPASWYSRDASALALFEMSDGIQYSYRGSWCAEGLSTTWESEWRIIGTEGSVWWNGGDIFKAEKVTAAKGFLFQTESVDVPDADLPNAFAGHAGCIRDFLDALDAGRAPETLCTDNIISFAMTQFAIASSDQGQPCEITVEI